MTVTDTDTLKERVVQSLCQSGQRLCKGLSCRRTVAPLGPLTGTMRNPIH